MGMNFLLCDLKPIPHPVEVVHIDQPPPGHVHLLGDAGGAVPPGQLPELL